MDYRGNPNLGPTLGSKPKPHEMGLTELYLGGAMGAYRGY